MYMITSSGCNNCRGVLTVNQTYDSLLRNSEYYAISHFAEHIWPGAVLLTHQLTKSGPDALVFTNTDHSIVIQLMNADSTSELVNVVLVDENLPGQCLRVLLPASSITTLIYTI